MRRSTLRARWLFAALAFACVRVATAQDDNIAFPINELEPMLWNEPLNIVSAQISRPQARGDITLRAEVAFGERPPMRVKVRHALPGAQDFNNVPRYDIAAYELQQLFVEADEYLVPPSSLRWLGLDALRVFAPDVQRTFAGVDDVLCVVQYWLQNVDGPEDVLDPARFATDNLYARHIGQLNVLTYLIGHADSNQGNFLISTAPPAARVFSIDHGVAFTSEPSDRGDLWKSLRVDRLPADVVLRLRAVTEEELRSRLGVLAQWQREGDHFVAAPAGENISPNEGVRFRKDTLQMGLSRREIAGVWGRVEQVLELVDDGKIATF
jgi:hypothetical protein